MTPAWAPRRRNAGKIMWVQRVLDWSSTSWKKIYMFFGFFNFRLNRSNPFVFFRGGGGGGGTCFQNKAHCTPLTLEILSLIRASIFYLKINETWGGLAVDSSFDLTYNDFNPRV